MAVADSTHGRALRIDRFFSEPDRYLLGNPDIAVRAQIVRAMLGDCASLRILDLGCGDGRLSLQFLPAARTITLVDRSTEMLDRARENTPEVWRSKVTYLRADLADVDLRKEQDVVLCVGVLAHVQSIEQAIEVVARTVSSNGCVILQVTDADQLLARAQHFYARMGLKRGVGHHHEANRMTIASVRALAETQGLRLDALRRYSLSLPGVGKLPPRAQAALARSMWLRPRLASWAQEALMLFTPTVLRRDCSKTEPVRPARPRRLQDQAGTSR